MSRLLESESDNDDSGQSSSANSMSDIVRPAPNLSRHPTTVSATYLVQSKLEHFSRRLSMLGLASSQEDEAEEDQTKNAQSSIIEPEEEEGIPKQEVPMTTSLLLNNLPKATNEALEKIQKEKDEMENGTKEKIQIKFQPIGSILQIKPSVCKISATQPFALIITFLSRRLKVDNVYCYINNSFAPNPQQIVGDLWSQFKVDDELIVSYCGTVAFG